MVDILTKLATAPVVGISGSRSPSPACLAAVHQVLPLIEGQVYVGCMSGIDAAVRRAVPPGRLRVFRAAAYGKGRGRFAARSIACVRAVAEAQGVWVSLPGRACPEGLVPSASAAACFCGLGSGSWASLALAVGLGVPSLLFLQGELSTPPTWRFRQLGAGWFWAPAAQHVDLFSPLCSKV